MWRTCWYNKAVSYLEQQFLIAMPGMADPNVVRGVTLRCQHDGEGALGITINRVSGHVLEDVLEQLGLSCEDEAVASQPVFAGGPVHPERGFVLHTDDSEWEATVNVGSGIRLTTSRDVLEAIAAGKGPQKFLVALEIGRASCRERVWVAGDAVGAKRKSVRAEECGRQGQHR